MAQRRDDDSESRRILERVAQEGGLGGASLVSRAAKSARDHVTAAETDPSDPIEVWGTRIGRTLGLLLALGLLIWLVYFVSRVN